MSRREGSTRSTTGCCCGPTCTRCSTSASLTVDATHALQVSPSLRHEFGNGEEFYAREGETVSLPTDRRLAPAAEFLEWHGDEVFRAG